MKNCVLELRYKIYRNPKLSNQESKIAALMVAFLKETGMEVCTGGGGNGVMGVFKKKRVFLLER